MSINYFICLQLRNAALPWQEVPCHPSTAKIYLILPIPKVLEGLGQQYLPPPGYCCKHDSELHSKGAVA